MVQFPPSAFLVSFDVQSLFTCVPIQETLRIVEERLLHLESTDPDLLQATTTLTVPGIMRLLTYLLNDCFFVWSGQLYRQQEGLPMGGGGGLSPVLAGIFMEDLDEKALSTCPISLLLYKHFVDDIFIVWDVSKGPYMVLLDCMNSIHPNIVLTPEEEHQGALPFLDLMIQRPHTESGWPYSLAVYRKDTHSDTYVHFRSAHPFALKKNILCGLLLRAHRLLKHHPANLDLEIKHLKRAFALPRNACPSTVIQKWILSFRRELELKPALLDLPMPKRHAVSRCDQINQHRYVQSQASQDQDQNSNADQNGNGDDQSQDVPDPAPMPWIPTFFGLMYLT